MGYLTNKKYQLMSIHRKKLKSYLKISKSFFNSIIENRKEIFLVKQEIYFNSKTNESFNWKVC